MKPKKSRGDLNVTAFQTLQAVTGAQTAPVVNPNVQAALSSEELRRQVMQEMGRRGGKKGGKARAESLSKKERSEIAKKAAATRWKLEKG
jgi:hypothetical protein